MSKLTLQPGKDVNGHSAARWKRPAVAARAADTSKAETLVPAPLAPAHTFNPLTAFPEGVEELVRPTGVNKAAMILTDRYSGVAYASILDTTSDATIRAGVEIAYRELATKTGRLES